MERVPNGKLLLGYIDKIGKDGKTIKVTPNSKRQRSDDSHIEKSERGKLVPCHKKLLLTDDTLNLEEFIPTFKCFVFIRWHFAVSSEDFVT